jgi:hypothetical protein
MGLNPSTRERITCDVEQSHNFNRQHWGGDPAENGGIAAKVSAMPAIS